MVPVQCQIFPCSGLYLFSKSAVAPQMQSQPNCRIVFCWTATSGAVLTSFLSLGCSPLLVFSVSDLCPDTRGQKWAPIWTYLLSCVVEREEHRKYCWHVCGVLAVVGPQKSFHCLRHCAPQRLPGGPRGHSPIWAVCPLRGADLGL